MTVSKKAEVVSDETAVEKSPWLWEFPITIEKQVGMVYAGSGRFTPVEAALAQIGRLAEQLDPEDSFPTDGTFRFTLPSEASPTNAAVSCAVQVTWSQT